MTGRGLCSGVFDLQSPVSEVLSHGERLVKDHWFWESFPHSSCCDKSQNFNSLTPAPVEFLAGRWPEACLWGQVLGAQGPSSTFVVGSAFRLQPLVSHHGVTACLMKPTGLTATPAHAWHTPERGSSWDRGPAVQEGERPG